MKWYDYLCIGIGSFMAISHFTLGNYEAVAFYVCLTGFAMAPTFLNRNKK